MKKIFILILGLLIVSCSNDPIGSSNAKKLYSIQKTYYNTSDEIVADENFSFWDGKVNVISSQNTSNIQYVYNKDGLLSEILRYNANNTKVTTTSNYSYDAAGRMIKKSYNGIVDTGERFNVTSIFTYLADKIIVEITHNGITKKQEILIDSNKEIVKDVIAPNLYFITYEYLNGNVVKSNKSYSKYQSSETFSYTTFKNDYNYLKYVFGKEWKLNGYLDHYSTGQSFYISLQSENLISEYATSPVEFEENSERTAVFKTKYNYEFNSDNQLIKETQIDTRTVEGFTKVLSKTVLIYNYK